MLRFFIFCSVLTSIFFPFAFSKAPNEKNNKKISKELVKDISDFSFSLYSVVDEKSQNNVFSPYSIFSCLSMLYAGASGMTASDIQNTISLSLNQNKLPMESLKLSNALLPRKQDAPFYEMEIANGLWLDVDTFVLSDFRRTIEESYSASVESLDFSAQKAVIQRINAWAANQTHDVIKKIIEPGDVDGSTRILITNAIYFKGQWQTPFDPKKTKAASFFIPAEDTTEVKMMENTAFYPYFENDLIQFLALPFQGTTQQNGQIVCLLALPKQNIPLTRVENAFSTSNFESWSNQLKSELIKVAIPQFSIDKRFDLNNPLQRLGMKVPFSTNADFSGIDGLRDLFLSKVVHQTFFSLNEFGVTASAASAASINIKSFHQEKPPIMFNADHPFIFLIVDLQTKTILFLGKFVKP